MDERASTEEKLRRECVAVLNQLAGYFARTLEESSFTGLLATMTHMRARINELGRLPPDVEAALTIARDGVKAASCHVD